MSMLQDPRVRTVLRVAAAYGALAWLLVQVAATILPLFDVGPAANRALVIALAAAFPPVLVLGWVSRLGLKKSAGAPTAVGTVETVVAPTRTLDRLVLVALAIALGYFLVDRFVLTPARQTRAIETAREEGRSQAFAETYGDKSIVVLPFVNMSSDIQQEHFSDGLSEELLNTLSRIPDLRVISRTSSFKFKGTDKDIPTIARELGVAHVLEGSVRASAGRIRITAQLIDARTDEHVWSHTFDRELDDIFAVQDEIAQLVATALESTFRGGSTTAQQVDPGAYALFLQGNYLSRVATAESMEAAIAAYRQAIEIEPGYALAWDGLARTYARQTDRGFRPVAEGSRLAREASLRALSIDPNLARGYAQLAWVSMSFDNDLKTAAQHFSRALALDPRDLTVLGGAAVLAQHIGRLDQSIEMLEYIVARDPVNPSVLVNLGNGYLFADRWDEAIARYRAALTLTPGRAGLEYNIGVALLQKGELQASLAAMQRESMEVWQLIGVAMVQHELGHKAESDAALERLHQQYADDAAFNIGYVHAFRNEADAAFEWLERARRNGDPGLVEIANEPMFARVHSDLRWHALLARLGRAPEDLAAIDFTVRRPGKVPVSKPASS